MSSTNLRGRSRSGRLESVDLSAAEQGGRIEVEGVDGYLEESPVKVLSSVRSQKATRPLEIEGGRWRWR